MEENNAQYPEKIHYNNPQHLSVEALELHYRIHASVLKYLELHEGKDIPNSLGAFFKKCMSGSKYLKKPAPPPPPAPPPQIVPEPVPSTEPQEPDLSTKVSSSVGFQEQFLNSLNKLGAADAKENKTDEKTPVTKSDDLSTSIAEPGPTQVTLDAQKSGDDSEDVIILSDSDDDVKVIEDTNEEEEKVNKIDKTEESEKMVTDGEINDEGKEIEIVKGAIVETAENGKTEDEMDVSENVKTELKDLTCKISDNCPIKNEEIQNNGTTEKEVFVESVQNESEIKIEEPKENIEAVDEKTGR